MALEHDVAAMQLSVLEERLLDLEYDALEIWDSSEEEESCYYKSVLFDAISLAKGILAEAKVLREKG